MKASIKQYLTGLDSVTDAQALAPPFEYIASRLRNVAFTSAGLQVSTTNTLAKTSSSVIFRAVVKGKQVTLAIDTDMPALTGLTITANAFNFVCFFIDSAGNRSVRWGKEGATALLASFPIFPLDQALVGFLLITHSSTFTGGTTALSTATTLYFSPTGPFDPNLAF